MLKAKMTNKLIILTVFWSMSTLSVSATQLFGNFSCDIKYQKVLGIKNGVVQEYPRVKDDIKMGDRASITYEYDTTTGQLTIKHNLTKKYNQHKAFALEGDGLGGLLFSTKSNLQDDFESRPTIAMSDISFTFYNRIELTHYEQSNWDGFYNNVALSYIDWDKYVHTILLDCTHFPNVFNEIKTDFINKGLVK